MRLGFACKVLGAEIPSHDARRWKNDPHLRVSIAYLNRMFDYLNVNNVTMYRISSDVAPYYTDPTRPQFGKQLEECAEALVALGARARDLDLRLSTHPGQYVVLNSPDPRVYKASLRDLDYHAELLDRMELPLSAKMVLHLGGVYNDRQVAMNRWIERYLRLPDAVRRRLVIENDDKSYSISDVLAVSGATGAPVVFDVLHHRVLNPLGLSENDALREALATWPSDVTPKIHYSDERREPRTLRRGGERIEAAPLRGQHADYIDAFAFGQFLGENSGQRAFDIMLEAKAKDLALFRLRNELNQLGIAVTAA